ncbi:acrosin-like [Cariama cristata]
MFGGVSPENEENRTLMVPFFADQSAPGIKKYFCKHMPGRQGERLDEIVSIATFVFNGKDERQLKTAAAARLVEQSKTVVLGSPPVVQVPHELEMRLSQHLTQALSPQRIHRYELISEGQKTGDLIQRYISEGKFRVQVVPGSKPTCETQAATVTNRKKLWAFTSGTAKDLPSPGKVTKSEDTPQYNFWMTGPGRSPQRLGATHLTQLGPEAQVRNIKRLLVHEHYSSISESNDIALLELDQPVQCGYSIQLACVPDASLRVSELTSCYVSGWGSTTARSGGSPDVLQEAKVRLIDANLCNSSRWYAGAIHTHNLCAGYPQGGIDTCQGDSGGPLVCKDNNADYFWLVGVTSWGKGCARPRQPGVYTSTQHFYDWILLQMGLRPAVTAAPRPRPVVTSAPFPRPSPGPRPIPAQSGGLTPCPFPRQKLVEFFKLLQELLQYLKGKKA